MFEVVGFKRVDFKAPDSGDSIRGYTVYCLCDDDQIEGRACEHFFITDRKCNGWKPVVGDIVDIRYNKYGKIDSVMH